MSDGSDTPSMLQSIEDTEVTFFSAGSLVKSLSMKEHIEVLKRPKCCGLIRPKERKSPAEQPMITK